MEKPTLYLIGGPTASGKSGLATRLAARVQGTLINADSMQIYQGLPLLTAQPSPEDQAKAPHLLYEVAPPTERFSVGKWLESAEIAIKNALAAGRTPLLVGGTGLYFKAFMEGLAEIPAIPDTVRQETQNLYESLGPEAFRDKVRGLDPSVQATDRQRLIRAYEVIVGTGKPLSFWQNRNISLAIGRSFHVKPFLLMPEREDLYNACDRRFLQMMEDGAVDEARALLDQNLDPDLPAMKILGVREIGAFLRGEMSRQDAITKAQQMTRNYAKRQMTWFRHQWKESATFPLRVLTSPDLPRDL